MQDTGMLARLYIVLYSFGINSDNWLACEARRGVQYDSISQSIIQSNLTNNHMYQSPSLYQVAG